MKNSLPVTKNNMTVCKPLLFELLAEDPKWLAKKMKIAEPTIQKLLSGKWSIRKDIADRILQGVNLESKNQWELDDLFEVSELRWIEHDRSKVIYEYGAEPLSDDDKAGLIRYLLEGTFNGYSIRDIILLFLWLGLIGTTIALIAFFSQK